MVGFVHLDVAAGIQLESDGRAVQAGLHVTDLIFDLGLGVRIFGFGRVILLRFVRVEACGRGAARVPGHLECLDARPCRLDGIAEGVSGQGGDARRAGTGIVPKSRAHAIPLSVSRGLLQPHALGREAYLAP